MNWRRKHNWLAEDMQMTRSNLNCVYVIFMRKPIVTVVSFLILCNFRTLVQFKRATQNNGDATVTRLSSSWPQFLQPVRIDPISGQKNRIRNLDSLQNWKKKINQIMVSNSKWWHCETQKEPKKTNPGGRKWSLMQMRQRAREWEKEKMWRRLCPVSVVRLSGKQWGTFDWMGIEEWPAAAFRLLIGCRGPRRRSEGQRGGGCLVFHPAETTILSRFCYGNLPFRNSTFGSSRSIRVESMKDWTWDFLNS